jgi:hypothetical protein
VKAKIRRIFTIIYHADHWIESQRVREGTNIEQSLSDGCSQADRISGVIGDRAHDVV